MSCNLLFVFSEIKIEIQCKNKLNNNANQYFRPTVRFRIFVCGLKSEICCEMFTPLIMEYRKSRVIKSKISVPAPKCQLKRKGL